MCKLLVAGLFLIRLSVAAPVQGGTVTGQLLDISGRPVAGVRIAAAEAGDTPATTGVLTAISETDKTGHYRLEDVPQGRYFILAGRIDYPTYYPGVTTRSEAKAVEVQPGAAVSGIDFPMLRATRLRISGRIQSSVPVSSVPVALFGAAGEPLKTETRVDGAFEFTEVPPGSYTLRAPGVIPVNVAAVDRDVVIDLVPLYSGPGVRVSGRMTGGSTALQPGLRRTVTLNPIETNPITGSHLALPRVAGSAIRGDLETSVSKDGAFEFASVPPGPYLLRIQPAAPGVPSRRLDIADQDVGGLEIAIPMQLDISGRVQLDSRSRDIGFEGVVEARQDDFITATSILPDGTFRLRLTEGENRISLARLPPDLAVKSVMYGGQDITSVALKLDKTATPQQMTVILETHPLSSVHGLKVSGHATGPGRQSVAGLTASLSPAGGGEPSETTVSEDGYFEFQRVVSGVYVLRFAAPITSFTRIVVGDEDVTGIRVPIAARIEVAGRVRVVTTEGQTFPVLPADLSIAFHVPNGGSAAVSMAPDRTFRILLPEDRYTLGVRNLPAAYAVRSIASGSLDLMKHSLHIDSQSPPPQIEVELEYTPAH